MLGFSLGYGIRNQRNTVQGVRIERETGTVTGVSTESICVEIGGVEGNLCGVNGLSHGIPMPQQNDHVHGTVAYPPLPGGGGTGVVWIGMEKTS